ncbi:FUSC family protein [Sphingomonas morindae]|uniref:FUSC family protein n=1 Tax=Sphingomonas morindae TaxID=1541170 RepID=A0ABY4X4R8_9SPHN|nr:FUSC family protein [Sphingomonas morindae]USI71835.1 FUSC family protein [Sphingomonas morindae]
MAPPSPAIAAAARQTLRVLVATAATYVAYRLLHLQQGYWAVLTVMIVMQGSLGGTLGAAGDRMLGTLIGALLGGIGAAAHDGSALGIGLALLLVTAVGAFVAALRPQLRIAPVTAAIMLLSAPAGLSVGRFVIDRILEIGLGGAIAVITMLLVLPARSHGVAIGRIAGLLEAVAAMLEHLAEAASGRGAAPDHLAHAALRAQLGQIEAAISDAARERASLLSRRAMPPAVPRTLWRIRNDLVPISRALARPLPDAARAPLAGPMAALLGAQAALARACAVALRETRRVERPDAAPRRRFTEAFDAFRRDEAGQAIDVDGAGRLFGLAFAAEELAQDLDDLAGRIDEMR